jgi:hypothetical protein
MEEGGAAVSCDKEGRRVIAWEVALWRSRLLWKKKGASLSPCSRATGPPLAAAIVEEGRSKVTPPCTEERERELLLLQNWESDRWERERAPWEKREAQTCAAALHVWEKSKREKDEPMCV